ncbi:cytochrome c oxidase accessory protein CcoG [Gaoshiqia sp. Z1-71]|uniref:cytochrome c oxidase accessory protein CcoG n=1 Tax=Gaoshiqia hydrogeniformans TaxID=3290090 RepID=UPI003BF895E0
MEHMEKPEEFRKVTFRDRISTVGNDGKRVWVFPQMPRGKLYNYRRVVAYLLLLFFYLAPHLTLNKQPLVLLDFANRHLTLFGQTFYPQDAHLLVLILLTFLVFIILFTVIYGRVFCGWACPQTIFMEFLYRPVEYLIDGNRNKQRELARQEMNPVKAFKRILKHGIFLMISFFSTLTFLAYIISFREVRLLLQGWPFPNTGSFLAVLAFTGAHYFIFAWFREQVCTLVCPYGRLQGVMLDENSIVVAYDYKRGEPRGRGRHEEKGDCIDCKRCVDVCPTGIDIRNGTQLECIHCTACMDACNAVMYTVNKPAGLIRYASERSIREGTGKLMNARSLAYSVVLFVLLGVAGFAFIDRSEVETTIIRMQGTLFQEHGQEAYSNLYNLQMINKTNASSTLDLQLLEPEGEIRVLGNPLVLEPGELISRNLLIILNKPILKSSNTRIIIGVYKEGVLTDKISSGFVGPNSLDKKQTYED